MNLKKKKKKNGLPSGAWGLTLKMLYIISIRQKSSYFYQLDGEIFHLVNLTYI